METRAASSVFRYAAGTGNDPGVEHGSWRAGTVERYWLGGRASERGHLLPLPAGALNLLTVDMISALFAWLNARSVVRSLRPRHRLHAVVEVSSLLTLIVPALMTTQEEDGIERIICAITSGLVQRPRDPELMPFFPSHDEK
jgi:hypothetical protein